MPWNIIRHLSLTILSLVCGSFLLQITAIATNRWASFTARTDLGKPEETGYYGLWILCTTRLPRYKEDCDALDTFFQMPPYMEVSGALGIVHVLLLSALIFLSSIKVYHVKTNKPESLIKSKILSLSTLGVAFLSAAISVMVAIFASVGENRSTEYVVSKGWSFWLQVSVTVMDLATVFLCAVHSFWSQHAKDNADPLGHRAETYVNPYGECAERSAVGQKMSSAAVLQPSVAFTESSGDFSTNHAARSKNFSGHSQKSQNVKSRLIEESDKLSRSPPHAKGTAPGILTYANPSFQEHSPNSTRRSAEEQQNS